MNHDLHAPEYNADRRQERRFDVCGPVKFSPFGSTNIPYQAASTIDLSGGGLCLKTDSLLKSGMNLCVRIQG